MVMRLFPAGLFLLAWIISANSQQEDKEQCIGVILEYQVASVTKIFPFLPPSSSRLQPYRFQSTLSLKNTGFQELRNWQVFIGFQHQEWLAQAEGLVLANGQRFPAQVGNSVGGATLVGYPQTDIKTSIETAGDYSKIQLSANLLGTEFGVAPPLFPLPNNLSLVSRDYVCESPRKVQDNRLRACCSENISKDVNRIESKSEVDGFQPRETGDVTISYDVLQTYESLYLAQVTVSNDKQFGRLDNWNLSWEWTQGEFIKSMRGAQTTEQRQSECIHGPAGEFFKDVDFSQVMNCQRVPTIIDLDPGKFNDTERGQLSFCCKNGTLLPALMDPTRSKSVFQLQVYKLPPNQDRDKLVPPIGFSIGNRYQCGSPRAVSPSKLPEPGTMHVKSAVASWQVTCNLTAMTESVIATSVPLLTRPSTSCCVSFSAFYNGSVVPCPTCACGCPLKSTCDRDAQALLLPPEALLVPFSNRTRTAWTWNGYEEEAPRLAPCGDNCGVSINWHVVSDHERGWTARMSILNWRSAGISDWFSAVETDRSKSVFQTSYSFNTTVVEAGGEKNSKSLLFVRGREGMKIIQGAQVREKFAPGQAQSIITFHKTAGFSMSSGDGFPSRVVFNGEECTLPSTIPRSSSLRLRNSMVLIAISLVLWLVINI